MAKLLELEDVSVRYHNKRKTVFAAKDLSFGLDDGDSLGIVGESGSGKSTLAIALLRLLPAQSAQVSGAAFFNGRDLLTMSVEEYRALRWKQIAVVFQKAMNSLSPVHRIGEQIEDIYRIHEPKASSAEIVDRSKFLFGLVNLSERVYRLYPHELSGGMLQRVSIALSLLFTPRLLILDEATTALDVITQGQILKEIALMEQKMRMARIMITHDMSVVSESCRLVGIMYAGELMEFGETAKILAHPLHPYTDGLIRSFPSLRAERKTLSSIPGFLPDLSIEYPGCVFAPRCPRRMPACGSARPLARDIGGVRVACHLYGEGGDV